MIDIESEVFDRISKAVRNKYPNAFMTGEYVATPPQFPAIALVEMDNSAYRRTQTSDNIENHAELLYELDICSNKKIGKKSECKAIAALVDEEMAALGFSRTMLQPIPNLEDASIYRMKGRYRGVASKDKLIYRR